MIDVPGLRPLPLAAFGDAQRALVQQRQRRVDRIAHLAARRGSNGGAVAKRRLDGGGEEFVLVLPSTTPLEAELVLERLRLRWNLLQPTVTFSAGLAQCRTDRDAALTLIAADHALYEAKAAGRNTYRHATTQVGLTEAG